MHEKRGSFSHYGVPLGTEVSLPQHDKKVFEALSREAGERDLAMTRAMNPPPFKAPTQPEVRAPILPENFNEQLARVDREIYERGVAIDRERLLSLGKERFTRLLESDRAARASQRIIGTRIDLTHFESVQFAFANVGAFAAAVPRRKLADVASGRGADREAAAQICGFDDLWKITSEPAAVRDVLAFRDVFEQLLFARSLLERLGEDDRAHSQFFTGGSARKAELFSSWLSVLGAPLVSVTLQNALFSIFSWLAQEKAPPVDLIALAQEFSSMRAPTQSAIRFAAAVFDGFLLGFDSWQLWNYVGNRTRIAADHTSVTQWRAMLAKRYRAIENFHPELSAHFYKHIGDHRQFESRRHRLFLDQIVNDCLNSISALIAIAVADAKPVARFQKSILCEQPPKSRAKIHATLAAVFPHATFQIEVNEQAR